MRIGIFGGTFDPPHVGHEAAARAVLEALDLDHLLLMVANDPWRKSPTRPITAADDRFAMTCALCESIPGAEASRLEIDRGGPTYSIDTVEAVRDSFVGAKDPRPQIFLIIGADLVGELATWHRSAELAKVVTIVVVSRPGVEPNGAPASFEVRRIDGPEVDVSSSQIREALVEGRSVDAWVPEAVMRCIASHNLYAVRR